MVKMIYGGPFAGTCRPDVTHFSLTPETALDVFPPYSVSQENDKNKTNRTSLHTSSARAHVLSLGN